jgi:hypothetical protein
MISVTPAASRANSMAIRKRSIREVIDLHSPEMNMKFGNGCIKKDFARETFFVQITVGQAVHLPTRQRRLVCGTGFTLFRRAAFDIPALDLFNCVLLCCICLPVSIQSAKDQNQNACNGNRKGKSNKDA